MLCFLKRRSEATLFLCGIIVLAGVISSCTESKQFRVVTRWNTATETFVGAGTLGVLGAQALNSGILVIRSGEVRTILEHYTDDGRVTERTTFDYPIGAWIASDKPSLVVYLVGKVHPKHYRVFKWAPPADPVAVTDPGLWTDLAWGKDGACLAFRSLYATRNPVDNYTMSNRVASGVEIVNTETGNKIYRNEKSYQYPLTANGRYMISPIDRVIRRMADDRAVIGQITDWSVPPVVSHDGRKVAWYGPAAHAEGTKLFVYEGDKKTLEIPTKAITALGWVGSDLGVTVKDPLTRRWAVVRHRGGTKEVVAKFEIPDDVNPRRFIGSPRGDIIGLPMASGSLFINPETELYQELPGVSLDAWRFSPDGKRLYFVSESQILKFDLN